VAQHAPMWLAATATDKSNNQAVRNNYRKENKKDQPVLCSCHLGEEAATAKKQSNLFETIL